MIRSPTLAPPELKAVHPLGKSPLLEDDGVMIEESGAIVQHLLDRHSTGPFKPASEDALRHLQYMHFAEGSAMTPILLQLYTSRLGDAAAPLQPRIAEQLIVIFSIWKINCVPPAILSAMTGPGPT